MVVGIDARVALAGGRGWGRCATELIRALARRRDVELRVLCPEGGDAERLASGWPRSVAVAHAPRPAPASRDGLLRALDLEDPVRFLGRVDLVHFLTRFVANTRLRPVVATVHVVAPLSNPPFETETRTATIRALERLFELAVLHVMTVTSDELCRRDGEALVRCLGPERERLQRDGCYLPTGRSIGEIDARERPPIAELRATVRGNLCEGRETFVVGAYAMVQLSNFSLALDEPAVVLRP